MSVVLMTPAEVAGMAFADNPGFDETLVGTFSIVAAQEKFLRPVLGRLLDLLVQERFGEFLDDYVKPVLVVYVKLLLLPKLAVKVGNGGLMMHGSESFSPPGVEQLGVLARALRCEGDILMRRAVNYIEDHRGDFPEYDPRDSSMAGVRIVGDIVF